MFVSILALRDEESKYAQESGDDVHQHKQILKELETKLQSSESMAEKYEIRCQDLQVNQKDVYVVVEKIIVLCFFLCSELLKP